jgi:hypothetical protein
MAWNGAGTRRVAGFAVVGALALLATACGNSSSSSPTAAGSGSGSGSSGSPSAPAASGSSGLGSSAPGSPSAPASSASAHAAGVPSCATSDLTLSEGVSQGTAGSVYQTIVFTNNGSSDCTLYGYPGVSLWGGNPAAQIGAAAARSTTTPAGLVTLAPGGTANAAVQVTVAGNYPASTCDPQPATHFVIYPPGQTVAVSLLFATTGCASTSVTLLHVSAVQAGNGSGG